jgi:pyruvate formate lyase activating enzyme
MSVAATKYWHRLEDGRVHCDVCPWACRLREGQYNMRFVREREGDAIVLTTWVLRRPGRKEATQPLPAGDGLPGESR